MCRSEPALGAIVQFLLRGDERGTTWVEKESLALLAKSPMRSFLSRLTITIATDRLARIALGASLAWLCPLPALGAEPSAGASIEHTAGESLPVEALRLV